VEYARDVRPIFVQHCVACHGPTKQKGDLRLDTPAGARKGGESGPAIVAKNSTQSRLIRYVAGLEEGSQMPPEGEPLSAVQVGILRAWIDAGAEGTAEDDAAAALAAKPWWSFQPLVRPAVPAVAAEQTKWIRNPVDAFIWQRLQEKDLQHSPEADRRTLIRRLSFDLTGLPPSPQEVAQFIQDPSDNAYETLVERLLMSPRYGERWARHWLDVVHYADSHGQDQDRQRPNAWPYRDYVIRALNDDKPYAQFIREQVAGDVLAPEDPEAIIATGFLAAGPWDESGLMGIREDSLDRQIARYLDRDDIVSSTMSTFTGLTVGCARCHDHKFDPISQADYYSLQAVFAGIDKAERTFDADPQVAAKRSALNEQLASLKARQGKEEADFLTAERQAAVKAVEAAWQATEKDWTVLEPIAWQAKEGATLQKLADRSILSGGVRPDKETYTITLATELSSITGLRLEVLSDESLPMRGPGRQDNGNLHLSEIRIETIPAGQPEKGTLLKIKSAQADFDQTGWGISRAIDGDPATAWGIHPAVGQSHWGLFELAETANLPTGTTLVVELDQLHGGGHLIGRLRLAATSSLQLAVGKTAVSGELLQLLQVPAANRTTAQLAELGRLVWERQLEQELAALPPQNKVYCGTNRFSAEGSFKPTATPREVRLLKRGDISKPAEIALPGSITAVSNLPGRFQLANLTDEGLRRAALAGWLAHQDNPLTWRVLVNRVWQHHFGKGLVDTPNDLGRMGGTCSHPELLDWLAAEFRDSGGSLKQLHRLLVTSSTYRQQVAQNAQAAAVDADNRLLWRMNRTRLDAESLRDGVLQVSGRLNETMYGPPVMHFLMKPGVHVTPVANYEQFNVDLPEGGRRSIYRYIFRTSPDPLLEALDCPDGSQSAPTRTTSVGALQALALWNNKFTLRHAEHLAELVVKDSPELTGQLSALGQRLFSRPLTAAEQAAWEAYTQKHGLANLCRVLLNSSEFLFID
jgi:hypothetical protein